MSHLRPREGQAASWACLLALVNTAIAADVSGPVRYRSPRKLAVLENHEINESSGLACSRRQPGIIWTHNDSGDDPVIYAFNRQGKHLGRFEVGGAKAHDWEDMASVLLDETPCLLVGDVGSRRPDDEPYVLYLVEEPRIDRNATKRSGMVRLLKTVPFHFQGGRRNCESIALDPTSRMVLLATKTANRLCTIYAIPWPDNTDEEEVKEAVPVSRANVQMVTAMDVSPDGRRAILAGYSTGMEFYRRKDEDWDQAFKQNGRLVLLPFRRQGESICYGTDGKTIYVTSEKLPTPLFEIQPIESPARNRLPTE